MAWTTLVTGQRWTSSSPAIYLDFYYDHYRNGSSMWYKTKTVISTVSGASYFGYSISQDMSMDYTLRDSSVLKENSPSQWTSQIEYESVWKEVPYKTSGVTALSFRMYSNSGRDATYSYNMYVDPAGSVLGTVPSFNIDSSSGVGSAFSVPCTKYYSAYYDVLTIKIGANTVATRNDYISGNVTFTNAELTTATTGVYARMSTVMNTTFTFELRTYTESSKTTQIGSTSSTTAQGYLISAPPLLSSTNVTHLDSNSTTVALTGSNTKFIQGYSTLQITVSAKATAQSVATLGNNAYVFEVPGETTQYANQSDSLNFVKSFTTIGYNTYNLKVIDSRGQQLTIPKTLTNWTAYSSPVISSISVTRQNGSDADILISFIGTYTDWTGLSTTNSIQTARFRYKEVGGAYGSYTTITLTTNASGSFSKTSYNPVDLDKYKSYDFEIEVIDRLSNNIQTITVPVGTSTMALDIGNKLVGVGKIPTNTYAYGSIDAAGDIYTNLVKVQTIDYYDLITSYTLASAGTSITISSLSLDLTTHNFEVVFATYHDQVGAISQPKLQINSLTSEYYYSKISAIGTLTASGSLTPDAYYYHNDAAFVIGRIDGQYARTTMRIYLTYTDRIQYQSHCSSTKSGGQNVSFWGGHNATSGNSTITDLTFTSPEGYNFVGTYTKIQIYRYKK